MGGREAKLAERQGHRYGPLKIEQKKRQVARQRKERNIAPETQPENISQSSNQTSKDDTSDHVKTVNSFSLTSLPPSLVHHADTVAQMAKVLKRLDASNKGVNFLRLVINPNDFGQSVENCFYASFMIKEGFAGIEVQPDGEIIIRKGANACQCVNTGADSV